MPMGGPALKYNPLLRKSFRLNPKNPDRNDGPEHGKTGYRPARRVDRAIRFGPVHHRIVPVGHNSLLEVASGG
jgi:hypothetical protein